MMVATGASVQLRIADMCNGANLAYTRKVFEVVNGFKGIDDIASGDDMLLLTKVRERFPEGVHFVKSRAATVLTPPQPDLGAFVNQRLRWASKSRKYDDWRVTFFLAAVYFFNWLILVSAIGLLFQNRAMGCAFAAMFALKCLADFCLLATGSLFLNKAIIMAIFTRPNRAYCLHYWHRHLREFWQIPMER